MPRQRIPKSFQDTDCDMRPLAFSERPQHASIIGRCLAMWTMAEVQMALLLALLLKAQDTDAAIAVYLVLRRSAPRFEAITAAGRATLDERDNELLGALLLLYQSAEAERNALAHGCFGSHPRLPHSVLWSEPAQMAHYIVDVMRAEDKADRLPDDVSLAFSRKLSHYTTKDLEVIYQQISEARRAVFNLNSYLRITSNPAYSGAAREVLYGQLCSASPIREALHDLRLRGSKSKKSAPLQRRARRRQRKGLSYRKAAD
jgi:hypothetical protein